MKKLLFLSSLLSFLFIQSAYSQIDQPYLKEYAAKEAYMWNMTLGLSDYKTEKLQEILLNYKIEEGKAVLDKTTDFESANQVNLERKLKKIELLFSSQEYKLYQLFNENYTIDQIEYLKYLLDAYSKDEDLIAEIIEYREFNILPILRVHRGELEDKISESDKKILISLREELYGTLDQCLIECKIDNSTQHENYKSLEDVLFNKITSEVGNQTSSVNKLLNLAKKYKEEIQLEKQHFDRFNKKWQDDMAAIHEKYIMQEHIKEFRKTLESNSVVAWEQLRFDAFFMLLDPSTEEEAKKILKLGTIVLPHVQI